MLEQRGGEKKERKKSIKDNQFGKEENSFFTNDIILYIENPKKHTYTEVNDHTKVTGYKTNMQDSTVFLFIGNNKSKTQLIQFYYL